MFWKDFIKKRFWIENLRFYLTDKHTDMSPVYSGRRLQTHRLLGFYIRQYLDKCIL